MVAAGAAERLVDDAEAIEIEAHHGQLITGAVCVVERDGQAVCE